MVACIEHVLINGPITSDGPISPIRSISMCSNVLIIFSLYVFYIQVQLVFHVNLQLLLLTKCHLLILLFHINLQMLL